MLRFNVAHQDPFAGEHAGVWAVFPVAAENTLDITYMRAPTSVKVVVICHSLTLRLNMERLPQTLLACSPTATWRPSPGTTSAVIVWLRHLLYRAIRGWRGGTCNSTRLRADLVRRKRNVGNIVLERGMVYDILI